MSEDIDAAVAAKKAANLAASIAKRQAKRQIRIRLLIIGIATAGIGALGYFIVKKVSSMKIGSLSNLIPKIPNPMADAIYK